MKIRAQRAFFVLGLILCLSLEALAVQSVPRQRSRHLNRRHLRRLRWNPVFPPSHESLLRQNEEIDRLDLPRIHDDAELRRLIARGELVPIEEGQALHIEKRLDPSRRYCRPWTRAFLEDISEAYYRQFHSPIQVNSAVRTVVMQRKLRRHNRNAAPESGETASSHLAGITVDIQRRGMTRQQIQWVEQFMMPLKEQGLLEPEEERRQWVFHVAVSGRYADWHQAKVLAGEDALRSDPDPVEFLPQRVSDAGNSNP
ncbi:MAG TPA: DUF5715 family protein [Terriglobales bacterium]|nr:DUF5715 family protein [Terriglobales bacterium]